MFKSLLVVTILIQFTSIQSQSLAKDSVEYPYWIEMMQNPENNFYKTKSAYNTYFSNKPKVKGSGFKQFERWAENAANRINVDGSFRPADYLQVEMLKFNRSNLQARSNNGNWTNLGPFNNPQPSSMGRGVGRVGDIAFHPTDQNTIYAGGTVGGFWISTNKGQNWMKTNTDFIPNMGVSAIVACPSGGANPVIIIGTGDRAASDAVGLGTYRSDDGGMNFVKSNTGMGNVTVNELLVNPLNPNSIIAATSSGIFKSYNQGLNWVLSSSGQNFKEVKYCPNDTTILYGVTLTTFFKSINAGATWIPISAGLSSNSRTRMAIAVTAAAPNIVYLVANKSGNTLDAVYKSSNYGQSFVSRSTTPNVIGTQGWYAIAIESSASDSNMVFVGGLDMYRSKTGGTAFAKVSNWSFGGTNWIHADFQYLGRHPITNELFIGSDGGVDYSQDDNGSTYTNINNGLAISMIYNLGVSQASKTKFIAGFQDNGTSAGSDANLWDAELGGDGMECEISNTDTTVMFGSTYYGAISRTKNNGNTWSQISNGITETGPWVTPFSLHPRLNDIMVTVFQNVWVSKNIVSSASPTFTKGSTGMGGSGTAVRFSNIDDNICFVGWDNGLMRVCTNLSAPAPTFTAIANSSFGSGKINDIETSYKDKNILYVAKGNKVFKSLNFGATWTDYSANLPNVTMYTLVLHKLSNEGLYVGTESGIYYRDSLMSSWVPFNSNLSLNASVRDLEIVNDEDCSVNSKIFAATYGRGLWVSNTFSDTSKSFTTLTSDLGTTVCAGTKLVITCTGGSSYNPLNSSEITKLSDNTFNITPYTSGKYQFLSKDANGVCELKAIDLIVNPKPLVTATPKTKTILRGANLNITASGATTYDWTPKKWIVGASDVDLINIKPDSTITYTVKGIDDNGCENTFKVIVTVTGQNGISSIENEINIYPNPSNQDLNIQSIYKASYQLFDIDAKLIYSESKENFEHKLNISKLPIGVYFIHLKDIEGRVTINKFTVQR